MALLLLVLALPLAAAEEASQSETRSSASASVATPRKFLEIEAEIRAALRREAAAKQPAERAAAVRQLVALHREVVGDPRFLTSDTLQEYRGKIAVRLIQVKTSLKRQRMHQRLEDRAATAAAAPRESVSGAVAESLSAQFALVGYSLGGPVQVLQQAGGAAGGAPQDDGLALVELIQRTIQPQHWDVSGGPGAIVYFAPLQCLVVRASSEVHHEIGGVVDGLRAAGR